MTSPQTFEDILLNLVQEESYPDGEKLAYELYKALEAVEGLSTDYRPADSQSRQGGLFRLAPNLPTLIIPDLHGRRHFLFKALTEPLYQGHSFFQLIENRKANIVCLGDAFHGEAPVQERWYKAYDEYINNFSDSSAMDSEMNDNLRLLEMILLLSSEYPEHFIFIKGNHENIANEFKEGNYPFRKFVDEGAMVKEWVQRFLGKQCFSLLYQWEKSLPLAAAGDGFLVTHAEPARVFTEDEIINAKYNDEVLYGLTWTDNDQAEPGSVAGTLENFFPERKDTICFGGHRPAEGGFSLRSNNRYIQINHPSAYVAALVRRGEDFLPHEQIIFLDKDDEIPGR